MAIAQLAKEAATTYPAKTCQVCYALETIPPDEAAGLNSLMANKALRYTEISEKIAKDPDTPLDIQPASLARHAGGRCAARVKLR